MLNRRLHRMLVLHRVYAAFQTENFDYPYHSRQLEEEIVRLESSFYTLASFPIALKHYATVEETNKLNRYVKVENELPLGNILSNQAIMALEKHEAFMFRVTKNRFSWTTYQDIAKSIYEKLKLNEVFINYCNTPIKGFGDDKQFLIHLFTEIKNAPPINAEEDDASPDKEWIENNTLRNFYDDLLEELFPNWFEIKVPVNVSLIKAFQALKEEDNDFLSTMKDSIEDEVTLSERILEATLTHKDEIAAALVKTLQNWDIERVSVVDRSLLYMACAEMLFMPDIPARVTINEYLELAKNYSSPDSKNFVNGVLDKVLKESGKSVN
jgi:N utilization substance protein B